MLMANYSIKTGSFWDIPYEKGNSSQNNLDDFIQNEKYGRIMCALKINHCGGCHQNKRWQSVG